LINGERDKIWFLGEKGYHLGGKVLIGYFIGDKVGALGKYNRVYFHEEGWNTGEKSLGHLGNS